MNNKIYIIGALMLVSGILLLVIGYSIAGFNIKNISAEGEYMEKTYESGSNITSVVVDDSNTGVEIKTSSDNRLHMTYYENEKEVYEITEENGTLHVKKKIIKKWDLDFFNFDLKKKSLAISVPSGFDGSVWIKTSNGGIVADGMKVSEMKLRTSNGKIDAKNITSADFLEAQTSNGSVTVSDCTAAAEVTCITSNSKVELNRVECESAQTESSNGGITVTSVNAKGSVDAKTSNGRIEFAKIEFGSELSLSTSNNGIRGEIDGRLADYTVTSRTSNGKNNLPESMKGGSKKISATTSNGSIDINFSEG